MNAHDAIIDIGAMLKAESIAASSNGMYVAMYRLFTCSRAWVWYAKCCHKAKSYLNLQIRFSVVVQIPRRIAASFNPYEKYFSMSSICRSHGLAGAPLLPG